MFLFLLLLFIKISADVSLENLKTSYKQDYNYYKIEKDGSRWAKIADSHFLVAGTVFAASGYYTLIEKKPLSFDLFPKLLFSSSLGFCGEKILSSISKAQKK